MRVLRLAALIATAQVALVVILFSFGYSIAHAATLESQPVFSTLDSSNCGVLQTNGTTFDTSSCGTFVGSKSHTEFATTTTSWGTLSTAYITFYAGMDGASWGSYVTSPQLTVTATGCSLTGSLSGTDLANFKASTLSTPVLITNLALTGSCTLSAGTSYQIGFSGGNINGQMASYTNNDGAHWHNYFVLTDNGTPTPPPPTDTSTRIVPLTPNPVGQISTTTAGTSVTFSANYLYNTDLVGDPLTAINLRLNQSGSASSSVYTLTPLVTYPTNTSLQTVSYTLTLPSASIWLYSWDFDATAPWGSISEFGTPTQQVFVGTNPYIAALATTTNPIGGTYTPASCSITDLTGCVQNAIAFLFWPDATAFEQFSTVSGNVRTHAPFGYVYIMLGQVGQISGSTTPTFSLAIDSTIQTAYFDPIKNGLATVLWALAAMWFLNRLRKLDL